MVRDQTGLSMVEYVVLASLILAVVGVAVWQLAGSIADRFNTYHAQLGPPAGP